ncbi:MAG: hypothetical protein GDA49_11570 [Rhodospirillales bacterium]|nr:hypothetical protein [Rhodospirillales bacterium]
MVAYLVPTVAVLIGAVFLGERLSWEALFGMTLIVFVAWLVNRRGRPRLEGEWLEP